MAAKIRELTSPSVELAIDIGGTFTDVVLVDGSGALRTTKVLSSPPNFGAAVISGLEAALRSAGWSPSSVSSIFHGMTVATNAVIEGHGSVPALVTTKGFRDILEMTNGRRPKLYDLMWEKPKPLVPRRLRFEIAQRITASGALAPAFDADAAKELAERIAGTGVESVAVCLINSHVRPDEELRLVHELSIRCPDLLITASVELNPEPGEFERTSTAVVNAYVAPVVDHYLNDLDRQLKAMSVDASFYVMQSNGGLLGIDDARQRPVQLIESGPAAGVVATQALSVRLDGANLIAFDMGGTTAKASLIESGKTFAAAEYEVGSGMNSNRGFSTGAGYLIRVPSLDIAEVGAGGGSIIWIDRGGSLRVGPRSAGAIPGPVCYGAGGTEPTLSDACVALGYFNPVAIAGGAQAISLAAAEAALLQVGNQLGLGVLEVAYGAIQIAVANMTGLVRAVTTQRGRDPRDYVLTAFGGSGPAFAAELARALSISTAIVPPLPGLWSAVGLALSDPLHDVQRYYTSKAIDPDQITAAFEEMEREVVGRLEGDGYRSDQIALLRFAEMRYAGQKGKIGVPVPPGIVTDSVTAQLLDSLDNEHRRTYGHSKRRESAELVTLRVRARCSRRSHDALAMLGANSTDGDLGRATSSTREAYFGPVLGRVPTVVCGRSDLDREARPGPMIIDEMDSTTVIPPWAAVKLDITGNMIISIGAD
jgi:N-methylhydantoinase A